MDLTQNAALSLCLKVIGPFSTWKNLTCRTRGNFYICSYGPRVYELMRVKCSSNHIYFSSMTCHTGYGTHICTSNMNVSLELMPEGNYNAHVMYNLSIAASAASVINRTYGGERLIDCLIRHEKCWNLYVLSLQKIPLGSVTEHAAVFIYPNPQLNFFENATAEWLFDGQSVKLRADMVVLDGILWIPNLGRQLNGKYVTYRIEMVDGLMKEAMMVLDVIYGPDWPLVLKPDRSHYVLESGEIMPDVECAVSCNPPCHVSWDQHSSDHVLHLGKVTETMTGEYTCRAKGYNSTLTRSIFLHVTGDSILSYTIATIGTIQAITVLFLIVCGVKCCVKTNRVQYAGSCSCFTGNLSRRTGADNGSETTEERDVQAIEIQEARAYEALDARTRWASPIIEVFSHAQTESVNNQDVYETIGL